MAGSSPTLKFTVRRQPAVLVPPAEATPRELKRLSDIDDQDGLRFHIPIIQFYRRGAHQSGRDPVLVIRDALARALVHYYPFAGRLRELEGRKLAVDCTGEGALFVEADANVRLEHFGDALQPPFPCLGELIFDVPGSSEMLGSPLLLIQVTRLACGGFILAAREPHTVADAQGLVQFLGAVAELTRGAATPTVRPVWERELLEARDPPRPTFAHREYDEVPSTNQGPVVLPNDMVHRSFFFGRQEVAAIRAHLPHHLRSRASTFDVITGCLWKCRTAALAPDPHAVMRMICIASARGNRKSGALVIPKGYYGNTFAFPAALTTAGELRASPVGYAVELVKRAKRGVDVEYLRSVADLMVLRGRPHFAVAHAFLVSDVTKAGFSDLDFGWGKPAYGGPAKGSVGPFPGMASFLVASKDADGEHGVVVPMCLPGLAMDRFAEEMDKMLSSLRSAL